MQKAILQLPTEIQMELINDRQKYDLRSDYLHALLFVLKELPKSLACSDTFLTVNQFQKIKSAVEVISDIGITPCLLPGVGINLKKVDSQNNGGLQKSLTEFQKYTQLSHCINILVDCYKEVALRPALINEIGSIIAALLQLSHVPLMKPIPDDKLIDQADKQDVQFKMTFALYKQLMNDQKEFSSKLQYIIDECPKSVIMKYMLIILGLPNAPNWLRKHTRKYLIEQIMQPNGVMSLMLAMCEDTLDIGTHWDKIDTAAKLITIPHTSYSNSYYDSICPQLIDILSSRNIQHGPTIANCCFTALYDYNPDICKEKIVRVICAPLLVEKPNIDGSSVEEKECELTKCIENLSNCFVSTEAKFKQLPCTVIAEVAVPLFYLYTVARRGVSVLKKKVGELLLHLLQEKELRENIFSVFLDHDNIKCSYNFGERLSFTFGPSGGFIISKEKEKPSQEELADSLFDLVHMSKPLSSSLFSYLLKSLSSLTDIRATNSGSCLVATEHTVWKKITAAKLLCQLGNTSAIQEAQIENPESLLIFIKSLFHQETDNVKSKQLIDSEDDNFEILYTSLILVKIVLTGTKKPKKWEPFDDLAQFLNNRFKETSSEVSSLIQEVLSLIKLRGHPKRKHYEDLSVDNESIDEFEKALNNLADPLLPVRGHGLISLTRLIEASNTTALAKKSVLLCFFQENLKHDDSFIYLAAVNALTALAMKFPADVVEILVQEFINMPQRNLTTEVSSENRAKLGEILVKVTKGLGDMAPVYKNILINAFLCSTRDEDPLVRSSSLSCLGELCKVLGFRLGHMTIEVLYCIGCIIKTDKAPECRRAAVLVVTLLFRGLGKAVLTDIAKDLVDIYRGLKNLRDNDNDSVLRLHAQLALEELDDIVRDFLFAKPLLEKKIVMELS
ncbi:transport and Golgi organization protein 6 homolog isoform X2 [Orussus abietinus]|nr:transport and Golgi organization protein 6 homolog isoform X2 [Orussus abietinus]